MAASRNPLARLDHIDDEISGLRNALHDTTFETFAESYVLRRAYFEVDTIILWRIVIAQLPTVQAEVA